MLLTILAALSLPAEKPMKVVKIVKIEGSSFKVRQRGSEATVARQAMVVNANTHHFVLAKRAAEIATNCTVVDSFPINALLNVNLDCATKPEPASPDVEIIDKK